LAAPDIQFLIATLGPLWPPAGHPSGGWSGNTNAWDAAEFIRSLINRLSATTTAAATDALTSLIADQALGAYRDGLKHALAQHRIARREAEFNRPNWTQTLLALANEAPANAADLHALVVDHLSDLACAIDGANVDLFKQFWNETGRGAPSTPKPEESCRDVLVNLLRPQLFPLGLNVEPEGHMSADKRVDIVVARPGLKLVVEVKLAHSPDLWEAAESQLNHLHTRDPETKGFGVLLVIWFGERSDKPVTVCLDTGASPSPPQVLAAELASATARQSKRIAALVVDVSGKR
jgi:hypothetical protein